MKKFIYLAIFIFLSSSFAFAQKSKTTYLDKHFLPLSNKSLGEKQYQKNSFPVIGGKQTETVHDLNGILVKSIIHEYDSKKNLIKTISEEFDEQGSIYKISTIEHKSKKEMMEYFHDGNLIGRFLFNENEVVFGLRIKDGEQIETSKNEFEPDFVVSKQQFREFLWSNLVYPDEARRKKIQGTVTVALEIMPDGTVNTIEVINSNEVDPILQEEAKRMITAFDKGFRSAVDMNGNPVRKWMYVPVRFSLG
jgi:TonB family protein